MFDETENTTTESGYTMPEDTWEDSNTWDSPYNYEQPAPSFDTAPSMQALQNLQEQMQNQQATINQINELLNPKTQEEQQAEQMQNLSKELEEIKSLKEQVQAIQTQNAIQTTKQELAAMQAKYNNFNPQEVISVLKSLPPQMAVAMDNPQGWEMIHLSKFANNLNKPDMHINQRTAGASGQPQDEVMKAFAEGRLNNEQIGKLF